MLLLATLAATASAHTTDGLDAQSLVQMEVGRHRPAASSSDACTCMSWRSVYQDHAISCGQGQELTFAGGMPAFPAVGQEFCVNFYTQVMGNFCTQQMFSSSSRDQWCYVSSACQQLNGGLPVSDSVSWKMCQDGVDRTLRSMQPELVELVSKHENRDAGLMLKMAYPISHQGLFWPDVKAFITGDTTQNPLMAATVNTTLTSIQASGQPMIFDSHDGHPPFGVVYGQKVVESHFSQWFYDGIAKPGFDFHGSMGHMNEYTCLAGCTN
jgi:hypothetical protein